MEPVDNLKDRACPKHQRPLEMFCSTDQSFLCSTCVLLDHKNHECMSMEEACESKKAGLQHTQIKSQIMVEQRRLKVQEIQQHLEMSEAENHREAAAGKKGFTALIQTVQRQMDLFSKQLEEKQKNIQRQAQEMIHKLQKEMFELENITSEAQQLSLSTDPFQLLQDQPAPPPAGLMEPSGVSFEPQPCEDIAVSAIMDLDRSLAVEFDKVLKQLSALQLRRAQQFAVDVTLDPDTANPYLVLSEDLKQVHCGDVKRDLPDVPQRFDDGLVVLGKQGFSSGKFYFEVQVKGKTNWSVGVAQESINRKGEVVCSPEHGLFAISIRNGECFVPLTERPLVPAQKPLEKVGVYVDYSARLVSFFDLNSPDMFFGFTNCRFQGKLLPFLSPCFSEEGTNSTPLIITAVETDSEESKSGEADSGKKLSD